MDNSSFARQYLNEAKAIIEQLDVGPIERMAQLLADLDEVIRRAELHPHLRIVVFLDEINTSAHLGVLERFLVDRRGVNNRELPKNVWFAAACNPFRKASIFACVVR